MADGADSTGRKGATVAQLKADIDGDRTGAKVDYPDPGLSPLGTTDEAGGTPNPPELVAEVREREQKIGAIAKQQEEAETRRPGVWVAIAVAAVIAIALLVWVLAKGW